MSGENVLGDGIGYVRLVSSSPERDGDQAILAAAGIKKCCDVPLMLRSLLQRNDVEPFEKVHFQVAVRCPLFVAHQWTGTNGMRRSGGGIVGYTQQLYLPSEQAILDEQNSLEDHVVQGFRAAVNDGAERALADYNEAVRRGVPLRTAYMLLPQTVYVNVMWGTTLLDAANFIRLHDDASYEMKCFARALLAIATQLYPEAMRAFADVWWTD